MSRGKPELCLLLPALRAEQRRLQALLLKTLFDKADRALADMQLPRDIPLPGRSTCTAQAKKDPRPFATHLRLIVILRDLPRESAFLFCHYDGRASLFPRCGFDASRPPAG